MGRGSLGEVTGGIAGPFLEGLRGVPGVSGMSLERGEDSRQVLGGPWTDPGGRHATAVEVWSGSRSPRRALLG